MAKFVRGIVFSMTIIGVTGACGPTDTPVAPPVAAPVAEPQPAPQPQQEPQAQQDLAPRPQPIQSGVVACPSSSPDSEGRTPVERELRRSIRLLSERKAAPGSDGAVTISFQKFDVGQPHAYRVYIDPDESVGQKEIYNPAVAFTTCTDFKTAISTRERVSSYACYKRAGAWTCGSIAGVNPPDVTQYIPK